ncbi:imm11 family protein [Pyxidicoccus sp. 3LFB2]
MSKRFFELSDDVYFPGRWELGVPLDERGQKLRTWLFRSGEHAALAGALRIPVTVQGQALGFSVAGAAVPIIDETAASVFTELAPEQVQLIPVAVESRTEKYFILNVLRVVKCIDDAACKEVQLWTQEDEEPELVGEYRSVVGMRIDPEKVGDAKVFRPWGWPVALIVSEDIKEALERAGVTGLKFEDVTGPAPTESDESEADSRHLARLRQMDTARDAAWSAQGRLEEAAIIPIIPSGPYWPGHRQAWRVIHREAGTTLLVTDGLSDPFIDRDELSPGLGLELAIETNEPMSEVRRSWQLRLLREVTDEVVEHENVRTWLHRGLMTMEVSGEAMPETLVTKEGRVAVLLGLESSTLPRRFPTPAGDVLLVTIKALMPAELAFLLAQGRAGPGELARRFARESDAPHLSRAWRKAVV